MIDSQRQQSNLSSALRLFVLNFPCTTGAKITTLGRRMRVFSNRKGLIRSVDYLTCLAGNPPTQVRALHFNLWAKTSALRYNCKKNARAANGYATTRKISPQSQSMGEIAWGWLEHSKMSRGVN